MVSTVLIKNNSSLCSLQNTVYDFMITNACYQDIIDGISSTKQSHTNNEQLNSSQPVDHHL